MISNCRTGLGWAGPGSIVSCSSRQFSILLASLYDFSNDQVPVPPGLDLDEWINAPPSSSEDDDVPGAANTFVDDRHYGSSLGNKAVSSDPTVSIFAKPREVSEQELARVSSRAQ